MNTDAAFHAMFDGIAKEFCESQGLLCPKTIPLGGICVDISDVAKQNKKAGIKYASVEEVLAAQPWIAQLDKTYDEVGFSEEMALFLLGQQDFYNGEGEYKQELLPYEIGPDWRI